MSKIFLWWEGLNKVQSFFSYFAIPSTVLIILQTVLTLFGFIENAGDTDVDSVAPDSGFTVDDLPDGVDLSDFPDGLILMVTESQIFSLGDLIQKFLLEVMVVQNF